MILATPIWKWSDTPTPVIRFILVYVVCSAGYMVTTAVVYQFLATSPIVAAIATHVVEQLGPVFPIVEYVATTIEGFIADPLARETYTDPISRYGAIGALIVVKLAYLILAAPLLLLGCVWIQVAVVLTSLGGS